ncbi:DUF1905 domain-containing protein [Leucobacter sp. CSA1]|uniref:DUF1905 domain-containing protein n=1 Tax=Leucobacter chromiisoli TaxID=2796471 RepID=A0A934Q7T2_9MICO|nr:YdeI/OmpD-associated family protein [Leucobacter chromiisoli]MBK0419834.1 DUF1905 domain-containing protein [Leucobacter chromiisoli]
MAERTAVGFEGRAQLIGDRLIVRLPDDASAALPSRGQVAVDGAANGRAFATVVEPDGMRGHWISIDVELRAALGVGDGDAVAFEIEPSGEWPEPELPDDFRAALADAPDLSDTWKSLTPMARWEWVRWIDATRNPQTRDRRVHVSISKLRAGKRRPCCFDLSACTDPELAKSGKLAGFR